MEKKHVEDSTFKYALYDCFLSCWTLGWAYWSRCTESNFGLSQMKNVYVALSLIMAPKQWLDSRLPFERGSKMAVVMVLRWEITLDKILTMCLLLQPNKTQPIRMENTISQVTSSVLQNVWMMHTWMSCVVAYNSVLTLSHPGLLEPCHTMWFAIIISL